MGINHSEADHDVLAHARSVDEDRELVKRIRGGDSSAFAPLYHHYVRAVYAYAATVSNNSDDIEEIVQETFVTAWQRLSEEDIYDKSALPWLLTTARFKTYNRKRYRSKRAEYDSYLTVEDHQLSVSGVDEIVVANEVRDDLAAAVNELSATDRIIFDICILDGSAYAEAAEALGLTSGAIRNRLARLRKRLRLELTILKGHTP